MRPESPLASVVWAPEQVQGSGEIEVARIADAQRGVIHRAQLEGAGLGRGAIAHRLRVARLRQLYRDVFLVGRLPEPLARETGAVLQVGGYGVLSHLTAGRLWRLVDDPDQATITLTTVARDLKSRDGLSLHRSLSLSQADVRLRDRLPVTSPSRTLLDLAGTLDLHELEAAYMIARRARLTSVKEITAVIDRAPHSKGVQNLRSLISSDPANTSSDSPDSLQLTRSKYERKLLALLDQAGLPRPVANAKVLGMEVDLLWAEQKLVVEFDSFAFHSDRDAFERDRQRDQRLIAAGYRVIRVTARQLDNSPLALIAIIAVALSR